jgi:hypothetical protein
MNLNESNIIYPKKASGLQKKELLGNKTIWLQLWLQNTEKHCFLQPPKMNVSDCKKLFRKNEKTAACLCQIATRLMFAWCGCKTDENTVDCLIGYSVVGTTDVPRLQKKQLQKKHVTAVATKKNSCKKNQFKKKSSRPWNCQIATRLVFAWCGCNLVKKYRWLQHPLHVVGAEYGPDTNQ